MSHPLLSFDTLALSIAALEQGLKEYTQYPQLLTVRDGVIKRFEFVYELSHKTLKRYLEITSATPEQYDHMDFSNLIRSGNEQGLLLGNWVDWKGYRTMRNDTSHTYDENKALSVFAKIPAFLSEACFLRDRLQERCS